MCFFGKLRSILPKKVTSCLPLTRSKPLDQQGISIASLKRLAGSDPKTENPLSNPTTSITARTPPTPATHALDAFALLQLRLGHPTYARRVEVGLLGLDAAQAAQLLVALLLPLGDQARVRVPVLQQVVVQLPGDGFLLVVEIVDVA